MDDIDATISRIEGDLQISVGPVGEWFPDDDQHQSLRECVRTLVMGLMAGEKVSALRGVVLERHYPAV